MGQGILEEFCKHLETEMLEWDLSFLQVGSNQMRQNMWEHVQVFPTVPELYELPDEDITVW